MQKLTPKQTFKWATNTQNEHANRRISSYGYFSRGHFFKELQNLYISKLYDAI